MDEGWTVINGVLAVERVGIPRYAPQRPLAIQRKIVLRIPCGQHLLLLLGGEAERWSSGRGLDLTA